MKFVVTYDTRFKNILLLVAVFQDTPGAPLDVCVVSAITLESARATLAVPALLAALSDEVCEIVLSVADLDLRAAVEARVTTCQVHAIKERARATRAPSATPTSPKWHAHPATLAHVLRLGRARPPAEGVKKESSHAASRSRLTPR